MPQQRIAISPAQALTFARRAPRLIDTALFGGTISPDDDLEVAIGRDGTLTLMVADRWLVIPPNGMTYPDRVRLMALTPDGEPLVVTPHDPAGAPPRFVIVAKREAHRPWRVADQTGGSAESLAASARRLLDVFGWQRAVVAPVVRAEG